MEGALLRTFWAGSEWSYKVPTKIQVHSARWVEHLISEQKSMNAGVLANLRLSLFSTLKDYDIGIIDWPKWSAVRQQQGVEKDTNKIVDVRTIG